MQIACEVRWSGFARLAPRKRKWMQAVEEPNEVVEATPAVCLVRAGEVHRVREKPPGSDEAQAARGPRSWGPRQVSIVCLLLCAVGAAAVGIGSTIQLSPQMWSGLAIGMSAAAGLLALLPQIRIGAVLRAAGNSLVLLSTLSSALLAGHWVAVTPLPVWAATLALCAPTVLIAAIWPRHWSLLATATAMVAIGSLPGIADAGDPPLAYINAVLILSCLWTGTLYGDGSRPDTPSVATHEPQPRVTRPAATVLDLARSFALHEQGAIGNIVVSETARALGASGAILLVWDDVAEAYRVDAITGSGDVGLDELRQVELNPDWIPRGRAGDRKAVVGLAPASIREPVLQSVIRRWHARSLHVVPFHRGSATVAVLLVARSKARSAFSEADLEILSGLAPHAAAALAHATLIADLKSANALKEEFMATMSHELRTPLNVIIGYTDMQLEGAFGDLDEEHASTLQTVREQAVQLLELIQATLDMSRLERGLESLDPTDVDVKQMLLELQKRIPPAWRKSTVNLEWKIEEDLPQLRTDPAKLQILLRNLIHNAMKFTNNGLVLASASRHPSKPYVTFLVQDSGVGIKAEHLSQIFDMFRQAPDGESCGGGVGLGLYIVKRLAAALSAEIEVSSAPGRGASFRIHVPLPEAMPTAE